MSYTRPQRYSKHPVSTILTIAFFVIAILFAGFTIFSAAAVSGSSTGCEVTDKDRTTGTKGRSDMRVYTEGCNGSSETKVFSVGDNWFAGQFASADTFAKIEVGKTYDFETRGVRIPILSSFENIVGVTAK